MEQSKAQDYAELRRERREMLANQAVTAVRWIIILAIPFALTLGTVRALISWDSPSYPEFEYRRISPDRFGFTPEERLELAEASLAYLRRPETAEEVLYLIEDLRIPGTDRSLYNQREIGHLLDVKKVTDTFRNIFRILLFLIAVGLTALLLRAETRPDAYKAVMYGGLLTAGILLAMLVLILVAWNFVFVQFHEVLFPPDTWTFSFSDSLIRLFPEKFWFDFGIIWTGGILVQGVLLAAAGYFLLRNTQP